MPSRKKVTGADTQDYETDPTHAPPRPKHEAIWDDFIMAVLKRRYAFKALRIKGYPGDVLVTVTLEKEGVPYVYYTTGGNHLDAQVSALEAFVEHKAKLKINEWEVSRRANSGTN